VPVLLSHGDAEGVTAVFDAFHDSLPDRCYAKIPAGHEAPFLRHYRMEQAERLLVMGLRRHEFRPAPPVCQVRRLDSGIAIDRVLAVFRAYPGHFFESSQLVTGVYVGGFEGEELVSVAGTHVFSPAQGLAVLGNIVTLRRARGRGYASACVSRLIEELDEAGCRTIALHVAEVNLAALACYRRTGFTVRGEVHQLDLSKSGL
jgi:ribosomal protein S18 acetylase RimI-like enzyme